VIIATRLFDQNKEVD